MVLYKIYRVESASDSVRLPLSIGLRVGLQTLNQIPFLASYHCRINLPDICSNAPRILKAAFIVGGSYGRGVMTCRGGKDFQGKWGAPTMMALEGASGGLQIGGQATDFVLLMMNSRSATGILSSKVKLGGDASAAAGPVDRNASAETDATMRAEILSYSRARGAFAGVSLAGSTLRPDNGANEKLYGKKIDAKDIVLDAAVKAPPSASTLISTLDKASPVNKSKP